MTAPKQEKSRKLASDYETFVADLWDFAEEHWRVFESFAQERGYPEDELEQLGARAKKEAGRS